MELKYYLRGLGLGIVITAIIMGITSSRSRAMTDDEIIARAKQLGMVEDRVLSEAASDGNEVSDNDSDADENAESDENAALDEDMALDENEISDEEDLSNEPEDTTAADDASTTVLPDDEETGQDEMQTEADEAGQDGTQTEAEEPEASVVITIGSGDGSYTVSKKLEDAGVIASASAFDTFLCENGYDKKVRAGNYTIPVGAGDEQIARVITGLD